MSHERCPTCGQTVLATEVCDPLAITISPCGHEISHTAEVTDAPNFDPLSPGGWITEFLAAADDN
ncbi:hypothetical protein [Haladaptatus caseinilyticus]|uniref:hypothetical protein n=1 Tax=Haladaptatus caseinilyticus TaxID=2993314 RepID=UPI00224A6572|nr:hypothetical protein [Haladaptatus caseinilyticus]